MTENSGQNLTRSQDQNHDLTTDQDRRPHRVVVMVLAASQVVALVVGLGGRG